MSRFRSLLTVQAHIACDTPNPNLQELMDMKDPLDTYIERSIEAVLQDVLPG